MSRIFRVLGKVQGKQSARTFWLKDKKGMPTKPITTTHPKTRTYESLIQESYLVAHADKQPYDCALELKLDIFLAVPKSYSKKRRIACIADMELPTKKPDNSNVLKSIEDGLNGVAFVDDKQIIDHHITKRYAATEHIIVELIPMGALEP